MAALTKIQWCNHTFNPWRGCTKVHTGCANCYAERDSKRFPKLRGIWGPGGTRVRAAEAMWREPVKWNADAQAAGERRRVFCASLADVFEAWDGPIVDHKGDQLFACKTKPGPGYWRFDPGIEHQKHYRPATMDDLRRDLFELIDRTPWLDWLLVTKRPERIGECWTPVIRQGERGEYWDHTMPLFRPNVWLLTSVSDQATADVMIPRLIEWRGLAPVLGVSAEPLLGPIDFADWIECRCDDAHGHCSVCLDGGLDWIILGGESGPRARPCHVEHVLATVLQCDRLSLPVFVKQYGESPLSGGRPTNVDRKDRKGGTPEEWADGMFVRQFPELTKEAVHA